MQFRHKGDISDIKVNQNCDRINIEAFLFLYKILRDMLSKHILFLGQIQFWLSLVHFVYYLTYHLIVHFGHAFVLPFCSLFITLLALCFVEPLFMPLPANSSLPRINLYAVFIIPFTIHSELLFLTKSKASFWHLFLLQGTDTYFPYFDAHVRKYLFYEA